MVLTGPLFIGENCLIKSHSNIANSIINNNCKVKGEIHTSIFQPFSNKAHEGFIGHSFIASWVNLGAGTTTSNLKNNYSNIFVRWDGELLDTKSIFFGSIIGEHVKTSIGANLNTGTIIEMGSNIIDNINIEAMRQYHGKGYSVGYRFNNFAYSTDVNKFSEDAFDKLKGLDLWIVDCVRYEPHYSHSHFEQTIDWIKQLKPKKAILTHMGHWLDYKELKAKCPDNVEPGIDGMVIKV